MKKLIILSLSVVFLLFSSPAVHADEGAKINLVLDSGHDIEPPLKKGSLGSCGKAEVEYNDEITALLAEEFRKDPKYNVSMTREAGKDVSIDKAVQGKSLKEASKKFLFTESARKTMNAGGDSQKLMGRPLIANSAKCHAFISIHHDSVGDRRLMCDQNLCKDSKSEHKANIKEQRELSLKAGEEVSHPCGRSNSSGGAKLTSDFTSEGLKTGHMILVNYKDDPDAGFSPKKDARKIQSAALASQIATQFQLNSGVIGGQTRQISNHHTAKEEPGLNFMSLGEDGDRLGLVHRNVAVLRETRCPAILIEVGNISDSIDEGKITNAEFRVEFVKRIKAGADAYFQNKNAKLLKVPATVAKQIAADPDENYFAPPARAGAALDDQRFENTAKKIYEHGGHFNLNPQSGSYDYEKNDEDIIARHSFMLLGADLSIGHHIAFFESRHQHQVIIKMKLTEKKAGLLKQFKTVKPKNGFYSATVAKGTAFELYTLAGEGPSGKKTTKFPVKFFDGIIGAGTEVTAQTIDGDLEVAGIFHFDRLFVSEKSDSRQYIAFKADPLNPKKYILAHVVRGVEKDVMNSEQVVAATLSSINGTNDIPDGSILILGGGNRPILGATEVFGASFFRKGLAEPSEDSQSQVEMKVDSVIHQRRFGIDPGQQKARDDLGL